MGTHQIIRTIRADEVRVGDRLARYPYYDGIVTALPEWEFLPDEDATVGTITLDTFGMFVSADDEIRVIR